MAMRVCLLLAMLALAAVAEATMFSMDVDSTAEQWEITHFGRNDMEAGSRTCNGLVGECIDVEEEMMMESEISRRGLFARGRRFISYAALKKNRVPCNRRGHSYYNCQRRGRANPYRRGCSVITRCARFTK